MDLKLISEKQKIKYNKLVNHVMQSWEWGEFREKMGIKVLRYGLYEKSDLKVAFQVTFHKIPLLNKWVGYLPKGPLPNQDLALALTQIGKEQNCILIKVESNVTTDDNQDHLKISPAFALSPKSLFSKHNFILDLKESEEQLLKNMHPKTRYNIRVAQKHGVLVEERVDQKALDLYLKLYFETTRRQGFAGHNSTYHQTAWKVLQEAGMARLLIATYKKEPVTAWMLFNFQDTLYYTYGGSTQKYKEAMSNNLVCWETIRLGKKLGLKYFDMWGALGPNPDPKDPWIGFHNFKKGYGGKLVEYLGTFDLVLNWPFYLMFTGVDKLMPLKVALLKLLRK